MKTIRTILSLALVLCLQYSFAQTTIVGSKHDLSALGGASGEICVFCHTPHNGDQTVTNAPLWNHEVTGVTNYQVYDNTHSQTIDATVGQPDGISKLCLSCHDNTVAIDAFGGAAGTAGVMTTAFAGTTAALTTDLTNDHPISFVYNTALSTADVELHDPSVQTSGLGSTIQADMLSATNTLECSSCHDPHDNTNGTFLRMPNTNSDLCLTCHKK